MPPPTNSANPGPFDAFCKVVSRVVTLSKASHKIASSSTPKHASTNKLSRLDRELWIEVRSGNVEGVESLLQKGGSVTTEVLQASRDLEPLNYKGRAISCQLLHLAAAFRGGGARPEDGCPESRRLVELLLKHRASPNEIASSTGSGTRELQAIHIAAGLGNVGAVEVLLKYRADPNADAKKNGAPHYRPIHDAAWFNRTNSVEILLAHRAELEAGNDEGRTALHLAAKLGHVELVRMLIDGENRKQNIHPREDHFGWTPLDLAVGMGECSKDGKSNDGGRFPIKDLSVFTRDMINEGARVKAFVKLAHNFPQGAVALLGTQGDDSEREGHGGIDDQWRKSFQYGVEHGIIDVEVLANLIEKAPEAAIYLIDALTDTPKVVDPEHHPLPLRAKIPVPWFLGTEKCPMLYMYKKAYTWEWSDQKHGGVGFQKWHLELAPADMKYGKEVCIRVVTLKGLAHVGLLHSLSTSEDQEIFQKLVIHALLKFVWQNVKKLFLFDFIHEVLVTFVLSFWILGSPVGEPSEFTKKGLWCCVASEGAVHILTYIGVVCKCYVRLGPEKTLVWAMRIVHRLFIGSCTLTLSYHMQPRCWPDPEKGRNPILAVTSLFHWVLLLFKLRAFQWTGQRLMPIMKSLYPISGMVVIMAFLLLAFVHAFWAMDMHKPIDLTFFSVANLLLTGEPFDAAEDLEPMARGERMMVIVLTMSAICVFVACALNVFIAVLCDCYDHEQERMICSFVQERARICTSLFLRPSFRLAGTQCVGDKRLKILRDKFVVALLATVCGILFIAFLTMCISLDITVWVPAAVFTFPIMLVQGIIRTTLSIGWKERYLWLCHEKGLEEGMFLAQDASEKFEMPGRVAQIKRCIYSQCKPMSKEVKGLRQEVQLVKDRLGEENGSFYRELDGMRSRVGCMASRLAGVESTTNEILKILREDARRLDRSADRAPVREAIQDARVEDRAEISNRLHRSEARCMLLEARLRGEKAPDILGALFDRHCTDGRDRLEVSELHDCVHAVLGKAVTPEVIQHVLTSFSTGVSKEEFYAFFQQIFQRAPKLVCK